MSLFKFTIKHSGISNGIRFEKGMTVKVVSQTTSNPLYRNGGTQVSDAFMRIYGIDMKKAGLLSPSYLDVYMI